MSQTISNDRSTVTDHGASKGSGISRKLFSTRGALASLALGAAAFGIAVASRYRRRYTFENKIVMVTGGSRGLGLVLARELAARGATLGLMARDALELARARRTIDSDSLVQLLPADVTDAAQVEQAFSTMLRRFGRIDVVINHAGWGALNVTRAAQPHLARHGQGRMINFAPAGLPRVMAEELRARGIRVTTVLPGVMPMTAERAARVILAAAAGGKAEVVIAALSERAAEKNIQRLPRAFAQTP